jgi:hypothetical protein
LQCSEFHGDGALRCLASIAVPIAILLPTFAGFAEIQENIANGIVLIVLQRKLHDSLSVRELKVH